jgi:hypothetical protein
MPELKTFSVNCAAMLVTKITITAIAGQETRYHSTVMNLRSPFEKSAMLLSIRMHK